MDRQGRTDEGEDDASTDAPGRRLERYIKERWTRDKGGMRGLATAIQSSTETMYSWFRGESEPSMAHLRAIADKLGVRRSVLVAILDGDPLPGETTEPESVESRLRSLEGVASLLTRQIAAVLPEPPAPHETTGLGR